jgi:hypothetical protein
MKVYLDDQRTPPPGWVRIRWPDEAIKLLEMGVVTEMSLDHDLGSDNRGTGYTVIQWLEEAVAKRKFKAPPIAVHTASTEAREKMMAGVKNIERMMARRAMMVDDDAEGTNS